MISLSNNKSFLLTKVKILKMKRIGTKGHPWMQVKKVKSPKQLTKNPQIAPEERKWTMHGRRRQGKLRRRRRHWLSCKRRRRQSVRCPPQTVLPLSQRWSRLPSWPSSPRMWRQPRQCLQCQQVGRNMFHYHHWKQLSQILRIRLLQVVRQILVIPVPSPRTWPSATAWTVTSLQSTPVQVTLETVRNCVILGNWSSVGLGCLIFYVLHF